MQGKLKESWAHTKHNRATTALVVILLLALILVPSEDSLIRLAAKFSLTANAISNNHTMAGGENNKIVSGSPLANAISNNHTMAGGENNKIVSGSLLAFSSDNSMKPCSGKGYTVKYPSGWKRLGCTLFGPHIGESPRTQNEVETFLRISVVPNTPSIDVIKSQLRLVDADVFQKVWGPSPMGSNSFQVVYRWAGDRDEGLPYVNQSSVNSLVPSPVPFEALPSATHPQPTNTSNNNSNPNFFTPQADTENSKHGNKSKSEVSSDSDNSQTQLPAILSAFYAISHNTLYIIEYSTAQGSFNDESRQQMNDIVSSFQPTNVAPPALSGLNQLDPRNSLTSNPISLGDNQTLTVHVLDNNSKVIPNAKVYVAVVPPSERVMLVDLPESTTRPYVAFSNFTHSLRFGDLTDDSGNATFEWNIGKKSERGIYSVVIYTSAPGYGQIKTTKHYLVK